MDSSHQPDPPSTNGAIEHIGASAAPVVDPEPETNGRKRPARDHAAPKKPIMLEEASAEAQTVVSPEDGVPSEAARADSVQPDSPQVSRPDGDDAQGAEPGGVDTVVDGPEPGTAGAGASAAKTAKAKSEAADAPKPAAPKRSRRKKSARKVPSSKTAEPSATEEAVPAQLVPEKPVTEQAAEKTGAEKTNAAKTAGKKTDTGETDAHKTDAQETTTEQATTEQATTEQATTEQATTEKSAGEPAEETAVLSQAVASESPIDADAEPARPELTGSREADEAQKVAGEVAEKVAEVEPELIFDALEDAVEPVEDEQDSADGAPAEIAPTVIAAELAETGDQPVIDAVLLDDAGTPDSSAETNDADANPDVTIDIPQQSAAESATGAATETVTETVTESDAAETETDTESQAERSPLVMNAVKIRGRPGGVAIEVGEGEWDTLVAVLRDRLEMAEGFFRGGRVVLDVGDRELTQAELEQVFVILTGFEMQMALVRSGAELTLESAAALGVSATTGEVDDPLRGVVEAHSEEETAQEPTAYYVHQGNLRSGQVLQRIESVIVIGDVNPGAQVVSNGDVLIYGRLRGSVHAGADGDEQTLVTALEFAPTQLRIAGLTSVPPEEKKPTISFLFWKRKTGPGAEFAYVTGGRIYVEPWNAAKPGSLTSRRRR